MTSELTRDTVSESFGNENFRETLGGLPASKAPTFEAVAFQDRGVVVSVQRRCYSGNLLITH